MKNSLLFLLPLGLILYLINWNCKAPTNSQDISITIDSTDIHYYLSTLSDDEFLGRKPFTDGEIKTLSFLKDEFEKIGLQPGNGDSYFQEVPLVEITGKSSPTMTVTNGKSSFELKHYDDFVYFTQRRQEHIELNKSELVFCGYGIKAEEYGWNDYEGIDMKGKTALVLINDPGFESGDSTLFKGKTMTYYGRWSYKFEEAARQGADAIMIIHQTAAAGYKFNVPQGSNTRPRLNLNAENSKNSYVGMQGWFSIQATSKLFKTAGVKGDSLFESAKRSGFKPIPLGLKISSSLTNSFRENTSKNVIGYIQGSKRLEETIIYTAHWDHLGTGLATSEGDSIFNGALDNASGVAGVMSIAKAFKKLPEPPERSVVFLLVTAEEMGLLGSKYYVENPLFPIKKTVANLNIDGMNGVGKMKDFTITGYGLSEMDDYAHEEAKKQGRYILPEQEPEKGFIFRSDQFNFAKVGIPPLYGDGGYDHWTKGKEYAQSKKDEYTYNHYHSQSDEYDPDKWQMSGTVQDAQLYFNIGLRLANEPTFPKWKKGAEFKR